MNQEQLQIASNCLHAIKNNDGDVRNAETGICDAMSEYMQLTDQEEYDADIIYNYVTNRMSSWPEGTGSHTYPVPDPDVPGNYAAKELYCNTMECWTGAYGELRLKLLDWLINEVESQFDWTQT